MVLKQKSIDNQWSNKKEENFHVQRYFHQESISFMCTEDDHRYNSLDDLPLSTSKRFYRQWRTFNCLRRWGKAGGRGDTRWGKTGGRGYLCKTEILESLEDPLEFSQFPKCSCGYPIWFYWSRYFPKPRTNESAYVTSITS